MDETPVVLITGSRRGIGRNLVDHFLGRGYRVVGCSRQPFEAPPDGYLHFEADVADEPLVKALFSEIRRRFRRLDVLINNAGVASMNHALLTPMSSVELLLRTNVAGTFLLCREAARLMMKRRQGRIVNVVSVATPLKLEGEAIYAASKAAVVSLTEVLAREFAPYGITVNAVGPTPIATDLIRGIDPQKIERLLERQAIRRMGEFRDVAHVIDFFADEASDFVTGQVLYLGGV